MSLEANVWVLDLTTCPDGSSLCARQKLILLVIADHHNNQTRVSYPSLPTIAEKALTTISTAKRDLNYLRDHQCLDWKTGGGRGRTCEYWFPELESSQPYSNNSFRHGQETCPKGVQESERNKEGICEPENTENLVKQNVRLDHWVKQHPFAYQAFCRELRRRYGALVGVAKVDHESVARRAAHETGVPDDIALLLASP